MLSFKIRSATRAATPLRTAISPARAAVVSACTATGITMAMNISAASTSASVNAAVRFLFFSVPNFITRAVAQMNHPKFAAVRVLQVQRLRTAFINRAVLGEMNDGQLRNLENAWHKIDIGWHSILGQLKVKQHAEESKGFFGHVIKP